MNAETHITASVSETSRVAEILAKRLKPGDIVGLLGPLGSGKTIFVQALARGLGLHEGQIVSSPTYAFIHEYACRTAPLVHMDFYRLKNREDAQSLGLNDYFFGKGICVVEWFDQVELSIQPTVTCVFKWLSESEREIRIIYS